MKTGPSAVAAADICAHCCRDGGRGRIQSEREGDKMPEEACAMVCGILSFAIAIISWYVMFTGEWRGMVVSLVFTVIDFLIIGYVLALKFHR